MKFEKIFGRLIQTGMDDAFWARRDTFSEEREVACAKARELGFQLDTESNADFQWDGKTLSVQAVDAGFLGRNHPSNIMHEIAHWTVCTSLTRRETPDYGLGSGPDSIVGLDVVMTAHATQREEERASMLGILMEADLGFPAADTMRMHSWCHPWTKHDGNSPPIKGPDGVWTWDRAAGWTRAINWLVNRKLVDREGNPIWAQVARGSADR